MKRVLIKVYGGVQGVFFRHTARMRAEKLGLTGWTRNEGNGSVAMTVEGGEAALNEFLAWCRQGPPLARIEGVKAEWQEATGEFKRFEIL